jgi:hypothetical protein
MDIFHALTRKFKFKVYMSEVFFLMHQSCFCVTRILVARCRVCYKQRIVGGVCWRGGHRLSCHLSLRLASRHAGNKEEEEKEGNPGNAFFIVATVESGRAGLGGRSHRFPDNLPNYILPQRPLVPWTIRPIVIAPHGQLPHGQHAPFMITEKFYNNEKLVKVLCIFLRTFCSSQFFYLALLKSYGIKCEF